MFGLSYIKLDLSRRSVRRAGGGMGLALRNGDGMGTPVHLWPTSTRRAVKAGRARGVTPRDGAGPRAGLCSSSCPAPALLFLPLCPSPPAKGEHSWYLLHTIWLGLHHLCLLPSPPPMGLEVFAQQAVMLFRGLCCRMRVQIVEAARHLIPRGWQELKSLWGCWASPFGWAVGKGEQSRAAWAICSKSLPIWNWISRRSVFCFGS